MTSQARGQESRARTQSAVHVLHPDLASCVRAVVTRSTMGAQLRAGERHNFYPASLGCTVSWTLQGHTELVRVGDQFHHAMAPSPVMFTGPQTLPFETRNPDAVQLLLLMFLPDAFHALTGVDLQAHTNQHLPLHAVLGDDWQALASEVMTAADDAARIALIEAFLKPRWKAARPAAWLHMPHALTDWAQGLAMRCVTSPKAKSLRQVERRIKQWTGQTQRQLHRLVRGEDAFLRARERKALDELAWADFAADEGFADQSHLCREFRKLTGLRPEEVMQNLDSDERLWIFKAWA